MNQEPQTQSEQVIFTRLHLLKDCANVIAAAVSGRDFESARRVCKVMWQLHAAGVKFFKKTPLSQHGRQVAMQMLAEERSACRQIQLAVNRVSGKQ